jgi:hypothetical protein
VLVWVELPYSQVCPKRKEKHSTKFFNQDDLEVVNEPLENEERMKSLVGSGVPLVDGRTFPECREALANQTARSKEKRESQKGLFAIERMNSPSRAISVSVGACLRTLP